MEGENHSRVSEFILLGLSNQSEQESLMFIVFLIIYMITVLGNIFIILAIRIDSRLHTPMYFFLTNLSLVDICFTSTTIPKMLFNYISGNKAILYISCMAQVFFFVWFVGLDSIILASMAYDRYMAICAPLHYTTVMNPRACVLLVAVCWLWGCVNALTHTILLTHLSFCGHTEIPHFFCDLNVVIILACSDTFINNLVIYTMGGLTALIPFIGILISYIQIFVSVLRIQSSKGKWKAFSTCGSHLIVVCLFYGTIIGVYFSPTTTHTAQQDTVSAVMYTAVTPMMNPFIYSLRNKDMKQALRILLTRTSGLSF
ncbi:LOW QUALITY PROTEIN: olfactory receptor 1f45-like [Macrotis lagotis]|uniref:LOW QUALITY PROTEIN: olfactory receptor 1f45-like n=1 Tax=Macrotis lagotis TaxID=92651 RepID=UPI003D684DF3